MLSLIFSRLFQALKGLIDLTYREYGEEWDLV